MLVPLLQALSFLPSASAVTIPPGDMLSSDPVVAIERWNEAAIPDYAYDIAVTTNGCGYPVLRVTVKDHRASRSRFLTSGEDCRTGEPIERGERPTRRIPPTEQGITALFHEISGYLETQHADTRPPITFLFHPDFGFPILVRFEGLCAARDETCSPCWYRIVRFEVIESAD